MSERWLNAERPASPVVYRNDDGTCLVDWNTPGPCPGCFDAVLAFETFEKSPAAGGASEESR